VAHGRLQKEFKVAHGRLRKKEFKVPHGSGKRRRLNMEPTHPGLMSGWVGEEWRTKAMGRCFQQSLRNMSNQHPSRKSDRESATTTTASQHQCYSEQHQCHSE
jgi:hypothetical protein